MRRQMEIKLWKKEKKNVQLKNKTFLFSQQRGIAIIFHSIIRLCGKIDWPIWVYLYLCTPYILHSYYNREYAGETERETVRVLWC